MITLIRRVRARMGFPDADEQERRRVVEKMNRVNDQLHALRERVREEELARVAYVAGRLRLAAAGRSGNSHGLDTRASEREAQLVSVSADYVAAKAESARLAGDPTRRAALYGPPTVRQVDTAGIHWSVPVDGGGPGSLSHRIVEEGWLPLEDIARVRDVASGAVMLDIGANIGTTAIPRALLGDFECVYAAEPNQGNYRCLVSNVIANHLAGRVLPDRVAISSSNGVARLRLTKGIGNHHLLADNAPQRDAEEVACLTLDAWLTRLRVAPGAVRFVKVDTQGWDVHVLKGASALLQCRDVVWQIEVSASMMKEAGSAVAELVALVQAHFTHVRQLGSRTAPPSSPSSSLNDMLAATARDRGGFTNLLLFNLA